MMNDSVWSACSAFALAHETPWPRDPMQPPGPGQQPWGVHHTDPPPFDRLRGPVQPRSGVSGVVLQRGKRVAAWGQTAQPELTFSVAKTYLALLAGVAHGQGLLPDVEEPVCARVPEAGFDSPHNQTVTWRHLLEQTSEWEGDCFGLPDQVDRWRKVSHDPRPSGGPKGGARPLQAPGSYWEYNDVRINMLSLALLHLFKQPLAEVLQQSLMQPLGAGNRWRWTAYDGAWVEIDGQRLPTVPGGTHWGGGVSISSDDQALLGQLLLNDGAWHGKQLLPAQWVQRMRKPCALADFYGWLLWLNPAGRVFEGASADSSFMLGAGGHITWIEPALDAVVVVRWLDNEATPEFMRLASDALAAGR